MSTLTPFELTILVAGYIKTRFMAEMDTPGGHLMNPCPAPLAIPIQLLADCELAVLQLQRAYNHKSKRVTYLALIMAVLIAILHQFPFHSWPQVHMGP